jgi:hypothetical protein
VQTRSLAGRDDVVMMMGRNCRLLLVKNDWLAGEYSVFTVKFDFSVCAVVEWIESVAIKKKFR